jgi:energy-coupling factor transporter ATP-binding protein EcfA2
MSNSAIAASGLRKAYGNKAVLDGIDLDVREGTVLSLLGSNGAGKTTTVNVLTTLVQADGGTASVARHDIASQAKAVRAAIGVTGHFTAVDELPPRLVGVPRPAGEFGSSDLSASAVSRSSTCSRSTSSPSAQTRSADSTSPRAGVLGRHGQALQGARRVGGRLLSPDPVDERGLRYHLSRPQGEGGEQPAQPRARHVGQEAVVRPDLQRPEHPDLHPLILPWSPEGAVRDLNSLVSTIA